MKLPCLLLLATAVFPCLSFGTKDKRPNVLLFTADDLHAESLGVYGGKPKDLTPNLDAFATLKTHYAKADYMELGLAYHFK